jgi:hypothetical protein
LWFVVNIPTRVKLIIKRIREAKAWYDWDRPATGGAPAIKPDRGFLIPGKAGRSERSDIMTPRKETEEPQADEAEPTDHATRAIRQWMVLGCKHTRPLRAAGPHEAMVNGEALQGTQDLNAG